MYIMRKNGSFDYIINKEFNKEKIVAYRANHDNVLFHEKKKWIIKDFSIWVTSIPEKNLRRFKRIKNITSDEIEQMLFLEFLD